MVWPASRKRQRRQSLTDESGQDFQDESDCSSEEPSFDKRSDSQPAGSKPAKSAKSESKPKHRFHIVKNASHTNDGFLSQVPKSSQGLHHIRGALWRKSPSKPPSPPLPVVDMDYARHHSGHPKSLADPDVTRSYLDEAQKPQHESHSPMTRHGQETTGISGYHDGGEDATLLEELADFPLDMLSSPAELLSSPRPDVSAAVEQSNPFPRRSVTSRVNEAPESTLRQMTLFGGRAVRDESDTQATQRSQVHSWPLANSGEAPTHHELDDDALKTWVYPTNLGAVRDYQYNIVARGLFSNLLVALPTGLGKTFIAAAVMLNWFRWTKEAQIVFVAPTRPLVAQQVNACFQVAGIPRSTTSLLTGNVSPGLRAEEWKTKRVFFMTPQTIVNDLKTGIADPKRIVLIVVDEAHRATGNYAYVEVVNIIRKFNKSFRVLALTATPGSTIESVQEVIDGLGIARTEIRTEDSIDIRQYVHQRNIDTVIFDYNDDMKFIMDLLSSAIKPVLQKVTSQNILWSKDPMTLTAFGCMQARQKWMASPAGRNASFGFKGMVNSILTTLGSIAHAIELLKFHGIGPFYNKILSYQTEDAENGKKGSKYKKEICDSKDFKTMVSTMQGWIRKGDFLGHPKLEYLSQVVLNHFIDAGEGRGSEPDVSPSATRVMIFAHFRDSAEEIAKVLKRHSPLVRPHVFVGQANSRLNEGMDQKKQQQIIDSFKDGKYNALIATSIGEEGLDIGQVDLIVCYDASASPIRMLQRMGRTGRKRTGNIVVLLMRKKEEENFGKARDNYEKMQQMIAEGVRFKYRQDCSPRIVPRGIAPQVDKRTVEIPIENSQADGELPEPKKRGRVPKRPPKKFHMPDGAITGFLKASELGWSTVEAAEIQKTSSRPSTSESSFDPGSIFLTEAQEAFLEKHYLDVGGNEVQVVEFPRLDRHTELQRQDRPSKMIGHSTATWRLIETLNAMHEVETDCQKRLEDKLTAGDRSDADEALGGRLWPIDDVMARSLSFAASALRTPGNRTLKTSKRKTADSTQIRRHEPQVTTSMTSARGGRVQKRRKRSPQVPSSSAAGTEGEGIDLMNTDDEYDIDDESDEDNGSDLIGFIDDATQVDMSSSSFPLLDSEMEGQQSLLTKEAFYKESDGMAQISPKPATKSREVGLPGRRQRRSRAVVDDDSEDE